MTVFSLAYKQMHSVRVLQRSKKLIIRGFETKAGYNDHAYALAW